MGQLSDPKPSKDGSDKAPEGFSDIHMVIVIVSVVVAVWVIILAVACWHWYKSSRQYKIDPDDVIRALEANVGSGSVESSERQEETVNMTKQSMEIGRLLSSPDDALNLQDRMKKRGVIAKYPLEMRVKFVHSYKRHKDKTVNLKSTKPRDKKKKQQSQSVK